MDGTGTIDFDLTLWPSKVVIRASAGVRVVPKAADGRLIFAQEKLRGSIPANKARHRQVGGPSLGPLVRRRTDRWIHSEAADGRDLAVNAVSAGARQREAVGHF